MDVLFGKISRILKFIRLLEYHQSNWPIVCVSWRRKTIPVFSMIGEMNMRYPGFFSVAVAAIVFEGCLQNDTPVVQGSSKATSVDSSRLSLSVAANVAMYPCPGNPSAWC